MIKTLTIDTDNTTAEQLSNLAQLFVLACGTFVMTERGNSQVQPLEAMGLASLTITDAWKEINEGMKARRAANAVIIEDLSVPESVGRWVEYRSKGGDKVERGRIKGWNESGVFVVYNDSALLDNWQDYTGAHTDPDDLLFVEGPTE